MADVEEVEREFRRYFMTGPVLEDWQAWAGLFTPEPGGPPIDFPSYQFIEYAGDGKWRSEEDVWLLPAMKQFAKRYAAAEAAHPQTLEQKLRRDDWGSWVDWARPEPGHRARCRGWAGRASYRSLAYRTSTSASDRIDWSH